MAFMEAIRQKLGWRRPLDSATPPSRQIPKTRPDASKGADPFDQHHRAGSEVRTVDLTSLHSGVAFSVTLVLGQSVAIKTKHGLYHFTLGSGTAAFLGVRNQDGDIPMPVFMSASILANLEFKIERVENTENQFNISPLSKIPHTSEPYYLRPGDAVEIEINDKVYVLQRSPHADCYILHNGIERKFDNCSVSNQRKNEILNDVLIEIVERNDGELGARLSVLQDTKATVCMPVDMIVKPEIVRPMVYQKSDEGRKIVESLNAYFASKDFAEHLTERFPNRPGGQWFVGLQLDPNTAEIIGQRRDDQCNLSLYFTVGTAYMTMKIGKSIKHLTKCLDDVRGIWNVDKLSPAEDEATIIG